MTKNTFVFKEAKITYTHNFINTDKPTLVCLHGFLEHKEIYNFLFEDTFFNSYNILALDLLGHNESECIGYVHSMEEHALVISELLDILKIKKTSLIGHSLGGYIALAFKKLYPDRVDKICLLNSSAQADSEVKKENRRRGIELVKKNTSIFIQLAIANLFDENTKKNHNKIIENLKQVALNNTTQGIIANMRGMMERKSCLDLLKNNCNIFYISGDKDNILNINDIIAETNLYQSCLYISKGYHMLWLECPEEVKKILKENL